jgi:hypothetical protein
VMRMSTRSPGPKGTVPRAAAIGEAAIRTATRAPNGRRERDPGTPSGSHVLTSEAGGLVA